MDGELHASPRPAPAHAVAGSSLNVVIGGPYFHGRGGPGAAFFPLAPDWVCEVLSPSTARLDRTKKLAVYAREGVAHAWVVDPLALTLEILRFDGGRWTILGTYAGDAVVRVEPFVEIDIELRLLWSEPPDDRG